jgi:hypothetical protein
VETKLLTISLIKDEMLMNPKVDVRTVIEASKLAEEDKYLYELMVDYMSSIDPDIKVMMLEDALNYTEEVMRTKKIRNEL